MKIGIGLSGVCIPIWKMYVVDWLIKVFASSYAKLFSLINVSKSFDFLFYKGIEDNLLMQVGLIFKV